MAASTPDAPATDVNTGGASTTDAETDYIAKLQALADQNRLRAADHSAANAASPPVDIAPAVEQRGPEAGSALSDDMDGQGDGPVPAADTAVPSPSAPATVSEDPPPIARPATPGAAGYVSITTEGKVATLTAAITAEIHKAVVGQDEVIEAALAGLFAEGHVLLEGVPGTAKTLLVRALAASISTEFGRIQFTPDLMPSDITGSRVYDMKTGEFHFKKGPIFTGLLLADEINRTPPKTQAALLESMQERRVTIDGEPFSLPALFMVFATQNPVEFEGTYPLPEAQLDRFLLKVLIGYPSTEDEQTVLRRYHGGFDANSLVTAGIRPVADSEQIARCRKEIASVRVEPSLFSYITGLVGATRENRQVVLGASPRASIALLQASKALAAMRGRDYVIPDDIKALAPPVLRHRLILRPEAEIEGTTADRVIGGILDRLEVPR